MESCAWLDDNILFNDMHIFELDVTAPSQRERYGPGTREHGPLG